MIQSWCHCTIRLNMSLLLNCIRKARQTSVQWSKDSQLKEWSHWNGKKRGGRRDICGRANNFEMEDNQKSVSAVVTLHDFSLKFQAPLDICSRLIWWEEYAHKKDLKIHLQTILTRKANYHSFVELLFWFNSRPLIKISTLSCRSLQLTQSYFKSLPWLKLFLPDSWVLLDVYAEISD